MNQLEGKVCVVTGSSRGIGRGIALCLAAAGAIVYVTGTKTGKKGNKTHRTIEDVVEEIQKAGGQAIGVKTDFTVDKEVDKLFQQVKRDYGGLDILVPNAFNGNAIPFNSGPLWELDPASWDHMFTAGVCNHILAVRKAAPLLIKNKGRVILTGYKDLDYPEAGGNMYYDLAMSCITRLTQDLAFDFKQHHVPVVAISPGIVRTEAIMAVMGPDIEGSQSVEYSGRAVVALATDPYLLKQSGKILRVSDLAHTYKFTDIDGTQPK